MFKIAEKTELNQISLTGARALVLVGLLVQEPRSLEEIREAFMSLNMMEAEHSDDILRIDLNTLRAMGCEITRSSAKTHFKYVLTKHPFSLNVTEEEVALLRKAYKKIKEGANLALILKYDELFKKIADHVSEEHIKQELYGLSVFNDYNTKIVNELLEDCKEHKILKLVYDSPTGKSNEEKEIVAQKLTFQSDKVYLHAYDLVKKEMITLNIKRIKSIISRVLGGNEINIFTTEVKFFLKNFGVEDIDENETVIEKRDGGFVVEGKYCNDFIAMQRVLSFGANCIVLEPQDFRQRVIEKLKSMRNNYNG